MNNPLSLLTSDWSFFLDEYSLAFQIQCSCCGRKRQNYFGCIEWTLTSLHFRAWFLLTMCLRIALPLFQTLIFHWVILSEPQTQGSLKNNANSWLCTVSSQDYASFFHIHLSSFTCSWGTTRPAPGIFWLGLNIYEVASSYWWLGLDSPDLLVCASDWVVEGMKDQYPAAPTGMLHQRAKCVTC